VIHWPGSGHHRADILREPRWEDFQFDLLNEKSDNRFDYFGNGWTAREESGKKETWTNYLHEVGKIDIATVHESWDL
jgi:hypothetical protein